MSGLGRFSRRVSKKYQAHMKKQRRLKDLLWICNCGQLLCRYAHCRRHARMSIVTAQGHLACAEDDGEATSDEPAGQHESTPAASPNDDTSPRSIRTFSQGEGSLTRTREGWQQVFMHDTEVGPVMAVRHATDPSHLVNESTNPMSWDRAEAEAFADAAAPAASTTAPVVSSSPVAPQTPITPAWVSHTPV